MTSLNKANFKLSVLAICLTCALTGCEQQQNHTKNTVSENNQHQQLLDDNVESFLSTTENSLFALSKDYARAEWIYNNFITDDTQALAAHSSQKFNDASVDFAVKAARFDDIKVTEEQRRMLNTLKQSIVMPAPQDDKSSEKLAQISSKLNGLYGKGRYTTNDGKTLSLGDMTDRFANSRNYDELLELWQGWREVAPQMKPLFVEQTQLVNTGAQQLGYKDLGAMWRSNYDMSPAQFSSELDRLWLQVKPLYDDLHCYVRSELATHYGEDNVPLDEPIPAHLLGNMWAQTWGNIYDLVAPKDSDPGINLTKQLAQHQYDEIKMVKTAEGFFTSLGFEPLPETFWQRSLFLKPRDRDVVCHASAWNLDSKDDLRIKMCIERTAEDFSVIHHELGHNFYQRAYNQQPIYFQGSANDGFHEAIGDTIALSVTPSYLKQIGLIEQIPDENKDIGLLLQMALDKVAFLPFGLLVDQWRWKVYSGEITPDNYNQAWWDLREQYQGIQAPITRDSDDFDPGAKYHIPGGVPYSRYFLAHILQFNFHQSLCEIAGNTSAIHRCSIYGNKAAGGALKQMLEKGSSQPWQDTYFQLTGERTMDASALVNYFKPLHKWLKTQNKNKQCGF